MQKTTVTFLLSILLAVFCCSCNTEVTARDLLSMENPPVQLGIETLLKDEQFLNLVKGKKVGLITNPTGVDSDLVSTIDLLHNHPDINLVKLFAPEHGVRGDDYAGAQVQDSVDDTTGIPSFSLHGKTRRPPKEYLEGLDVMIYNIQDVGSRSYTYIYTMAYAMEECGKAGIPFLVLDCPNPCGGNKVSGNILDASQGTSFVGLYAIPYMYGLTPGETAMLFNKEFNEVECDLTVVPMKGYERWMTQWDSGLPFIPSSPNVPSTKTSFYYNLTGIIGELFDVSIGVGYPLAFEVIAAPFINRDDFVNELRKENIVGVKVRPITLKPYAYHFKGEVINGAQFVITDYRKIQPVEAQIHIMEVLQRLYPEKGLFADTNKRRGMFDKVMGDKKIREMIRDGKSAEEVIATYQDDVAKFMELRANYLYYK
jgi:uncharacterized protein YbbC (DUF1343 family)